MHVLITYFFEGTISILNQPNYGYPPKASNAYPLNTGTPGNLDDPPDAEDTVCAGPSCSTPMPNSTSLDTGLRTVERYSAVGDSLVLVVSLGCSGSVADCSANDPVTVDSTTSGVTFVSAAQSATNTPTLVTQLSQTTISPGYSVFDNAMLGSANGPSGKITFYVSDANTCSNASASQVGGADTVSGDGAYQSSTLPFDIPETYYWYASYTGDPNNNPVTSPCEPLVVEQAATTSTSSSSITSSSTTTTTTETVQSIPEFGGSAILVVGVVFAVIILLRISTLKGKPQHRL